MSLQYCFALLVTVTVAAASDLRCRDDQFPCRDGRTCIPASWFCNRYRNCPNGSDEIRRNFKIKNDANFTYCRKLSGRICALPIQDLSNVELYCKTDLQCGSDEISCVDGSGCYKLNAFCDGWEDCRDGSDEPLRTIDEDYDRDTTFCRGRYGDICVLPEWLVANKTAICDEDWQCKENEFPCSDGSRCIPATLFCNEEDNCRDGSDETRRNIDEDYADSTFCRGRYGGICVLPRMPVPNKKAICNEEWQCRGDEFPCVDGSRCLRNAIFFCEPGYEYDNCRDRSDEARRNRVAHYDRRFAFAQSINGNRRICAFPKEFVSFKQTICDGKKYVCRERGREFMDDQSFRCLSTPDFVLSITQLCNGVVDCPDLSDECICSFTGRLDVCHKLMFDDEFPHRPPFLSCLSTNGMRQHTVVDVQNVCDGSVDCLNEEDEFRCIEQGLMTTSRPMKDYKCNPNDAVYNATNCDGRAECSDFWDEECNCTENAGFCKHFTKNDTSIICDASKNTSINPKRVIAADICDGYVRCSDGSDEKYCNATRFYCTDKLIPNIPVEKRCDKVDDCTNGTDEEACPHFYCSDNGNIKYLPLNQKCDGYKDCASGRDESDCVVSMFSDQNSMFASKTVMAFVWIISLTAIIGCTAVIVVTCYNLLRPSTEKNISVHTKVIKMQILSLSLSDFLVAVYTLIICTKSIEFDKDYFEMDNIWRSSATCSTIGVLLMIGSEQSVLTMVLIAAVRLFSVLRPFSKPRVRLIAAVILATWIVSIAFGVIPLLGTFEDYFLKEIWFARNRLLRKIPSNEKKYFIKWLSLMHLEENMEMRNRPTDWDQLRTLIYQINPNLTAAQEFGYYSSHTVCLPAFFPDPRADKGWEYTLLLLLINFAAFVAMFVIYIVLYKHARGSDAIKHSSSLREKRLKQNVTMQRKLTRIVVSDFLCWMPICIMGFLQMSSVRIPKDAYLPAGLIIIPINSALNPLLYSDVPDILLSKLKSLRLVFVSQPSIDTEIIELART